MAVQIMCCVVYPRVETSFAANLFGVLKLPLLETSKGCISESNAIARYIANTRPESGLSGASLLEKAQVDSWVDFSSNELEVPAAVLVYPIIGWMGYQKQGEIVI